MNDRDCLALLAWAAPRLGLRTRGFRRVRGQVCKRVGRRLAALGLADAGAYRDFLSAHPEEWAVLDALCRVTISRFYRDRGVFEHLRTHLLPQLLREAAGRGEGTLRAWSVGCASGEEPYSLALLSLYGLPPGLPPLAWEVWATDADASLLARAARGCYPPGTLRELPEAWVEKAFRPRGAEVCLTEEAVRARVHFLAQDVRSQMLPGPFHLVLCRNVAFTYFDEATQGRLLTALLARLVPGGALVLGAHEALPAGGPGLVPEGAGLPVFRWHPPDGGG